MPEDIMVEDYLIKSDRKYMKTHEWIKELGENKYEIGISDYAQKSLHEITYVQFEEDEMDFKQGEVILTVEAIKASGDIYAPFDLKMTSNNEVLEDEPEKINEDPYGEGWLARFECTTLDLSKLISPEEYRDIVKSELEDI